MKHVPFFTAFVFVLVACQTPQALIVKTGPNTDYPCGVNGVVCPAQMCCWQDDVCGGQNTGCDAGMCCFVGGGGMGAREPHKQLTPAEMQEKFSKPSS